MASGIYLPDQTEGIIRVADLPQPVVERRSRRYRRRRCPRCGQGCPRDSMGHRTLHDLGDVRPGRPRQLALTYSKHYCKTCGRSFAMDLAGLAPPGSHYTQRVISLAVRLVVEDGLPIGPPPGTCGVTTASSSPTPLSRTGSRRRGKKASVQGEQAHLDWALADFSGYLAVDEVYDGPFRVLFAIDSPKQHRLLGEVLDHDPCHDDIRRFLARLKEAVDRRGLKVRGLTTDASSLYPLPIREVFGEGTPHQICQLHVLKELTKAILGCVARVRKRLAGQAPKLPRGRPKNTPEARRLHRGAQRIKGRVTQLFEHRHLFVRHHPTAKERTLLARLVRGRVPCERCGRSWSRSTACSTAAAGPRRPWTSWTGCAGGCVATGALASLWTS